MRLYRILLLLFLGVVLAGCGPIYATRYTFKTPKTRSGRRCVNRCLRARTQCQFQCHAMDQNCRQMALNAARPQYRAYVRRRRRQGLPLTMSLSDFANFANCQESCGCASTYRQCFSNCGGQVITHQQCVAFCKTPNNPQQTSK